MKEILIHIILLIIIPNFLFGQYHNEIRPTTKDVIEIKTKHYNGKFCKSGWESIYDYSNGKIIRQRNWYKGELRMDEKHSYSKDGNIITKKTINLKNQIYFERDSIVKHLQKREIFLSYDSIQPSIVLHSYIYNPKGKLISYKWTTENFEGIEKINCCQIQYMENKVIIQEMENCEFVNKTITLQLDKIGNPIFETIDYHDKNIVITGGRSENGVQMYKYKYDKKGNWTKRYYINSKGKSTLEIKRKIKYK